MQAFFAGRDLQAFIKANVPHPLQQWAAETGGLNSERGSESKGQWHEAWRRTVGFTLVRIQAWQRPKHAQQLFNRQCLKPRTARKKQTAISLAIWHRGQAGGRNQVRACNAIVIKTGRTAAPSGKLDGRHGIAQESQHEERGIHRPIAYNRVEQDTKIFTVSVSPPSHTIPPEAGRFIKHGNNVYKC